ncbi:class I SAM-dependent methyltransferase [Candidatus Woesebacteria bacterium]|nr:class I SAM-dependent methyltransferase [Candidatus Woesebacteria bacterium]
MEKIFCNLCGSTKYKIFLNNVKSPEFEEEFTLVKCTRCGLIYLNPRPTKNHIGKYYSTPNFFSDFSDARGKYAFLYDMIFREIKSGKVFDIGAGTGLFLTEFKKGGWEVDGLEPSVIARRIAKKKFGINLKKEDVLDINFKDEYFDLVVLNNVIEHLYRPTETLKKVSRIVKKGGFVLISCPNIKGMGPLLFRQKWYGMDTPRHLYQFCPESLETILNHSEVKIFKISHNFYRHNYSVLFESLRRTFSPRNSETRKSEKTLIKPNTGEKKSKQSLVTQVGIFACKVLSGGIALVEPLIGRGEIITVLVVKPNK